MILLRLITWPYVRKHLLRSVLTTTGIVLGVALLVGMQTANQSVLSAFTETVDHLAGKAQLEVSAGDSGFPEEVLERVESVREVRAAAPVIESTVDTGLPGEGKLLILAVDMTGDRSLRDYNFENGGEDVIDDPLVFLAQPDSLIVTREFASRNNLHSGDRISFDTMEGRKTFTIRGILKTGGMTRAFGGNLGIMDIYAAQQVFGRGRHFDRVDIGLRAGVTLEQGQAALQAALGPGLTVEPPSGRGKQFESLLSIYTLSANVSSLFALLIGMFIIYNAFSIAVTQRRAEIGILRALGATRAQIRTLFLAESGIAGMIGSAAGVAIGLSVARTLTQITGQTMFDMFGVSGNARDVRIDPRFLLFAFVLGVFTSMLAAFVPARNASRLEPVQALQKGRYQVLGAGENRIRRIAAFVAVVGGAGCTLWSSYRPAFYFGFFLIVVAALLMTPFLALELSRLLRYPLRWLRPVEGALAADSLIQAPRRTSTTVAALMLSLALVVGMAGVARACFDAIDVWFATVLNPDLFVATSQTISPRDFRFPAGMRADLESVPGIAEVQPVRTIREPFRGHPVMVVGLENARIAARVARIVIEGKEPELTRCAAAGQGFVLSENLSRLVNRHLHDPIELTTPTGILRLPVCGVVRDFSNQQGTIFLERSAYIRAFQDDSVDLFRVYLQPGASAQQVRAHILDKLGPRRRLFVLFNKEVTEYGKQLTASWFGLTYIQIFVAVIVAILGIVNTLTVSISDRRRELGVLRAVGGLRAQIRRTIWLEAIAIGAIGLILGIGVGAILLYYELQSIDKDMAGFPLDYRFPTAIIGVLLPVILGAALGSAILPAETAVRSSLVEALEYE